ncbi:MAG TPA: fibronectin type III domain-containing protein [Dehalococcoidia bacterium]|nr:fibronectin type III domain-containing protein [Dehalococcoidia bacterium]
MKIGLNWKTPILAALLLVVGIIAMLGGRDSQAATVRSNAVVLVNSQSPSYSQYQQRLQTYLKQFGVPYDTIDISTTSITSNISNYQLIIVGHTGLDTSGSYLSGSEMSNISSAVNAGSGFFSVDGDLATGGNSSRYSFTDAIFGFGYAGSYSTQSSISVPSSGHYITAAQTAPASYTVRNPMQGDIITTPGDVTTLASVGGSPLMVVTTYGSGRAVQWTSDTWINNAVVGQFQGMDDLVWRGLVWAARKPFVLRGMPPLVSMRVDDATGDALGSSNFSYVDIANQYGFRPLLPIFFNYYTPTKAYRLRDLINDGSATASIHSFADQQFFYFNHQSGQNLTDNQVAANFALQDEFFATYGITPSKVVVFHYYESGSNVYEELAARGVQYVSTTNLPGYPYSDASPQLWIGPYRTYGLPGTNTNQFYNVYIADWLNIAPGNPLNGTFFDFLTEVRGSSYDLTANRAASDVIATGTTQLKTAFDSMVPATLFLHEYELANVSPSTWSTELSSITSNVSSYNPIYVTYDREAQYARALATSSLASASFDTGTNVESVTFTGASDIDTQYYIFTGSGSTPVRNALNTTPFSNGRTVNVNTTAEMVAPTSTITDPTAGQTLSGSSYTIHGTASANGGSVSKVEVSTNGGQTWANASGTTSWSYNWSLPSSGVFQIMSRATDSNGNVELPGEGIKVIKQDTTAPTISNIAATNIVDDGATITWQTDEGSSSQVSYGLTSSYGTTTPLVPGPTTTHSVQVSGLAPSTTYHYKVTSTDAAGNTANSSDRTFTTTSESGPQNTVTTTFHTTGADFALGDLSGTAVTEDAGGEVRLAPAMDDLFLGSVMDSSLWTQKTWTGGSVSVSGGSAQADGGAAGSTAAFSNDLAFEARATLGTDSWQQLGIGTDLDGLSGNSRAVFSTASGGQVYARTSVNGVDTFTPLPGLTNSPHTYKIARSGTQFLYFVDGSLVATHNGFSGSVKAWISDYSNGGQKVSVDWLRILPFAFLSGTYESPRIDTGAPGVITTIAWHGATPSGTTLTVRTRSSTNGTSWSSWSSPVSSGGAISSPSARYLQYQVTLASSDSSTTPELDDVTLSGSPPPVIISNVAVTNITNNSATVSWTTNQPTDGVVNYGLTSSYGSSATDPAGMASSHSVSLTGLAQGTTYHYQVTSSAGGGNSAQSNDATFTTAVPGTGGALFQTTAADFALGTLSGTAVTEDGGGEVRLTPALNDLFLGSSIDSGRWTTKVWTGGSVIASGGSAQADGSAIGSNASFSGDVVFEARATLGTDSWQQLGLGTDLDGSAGNSRAVFSTRNGGGVYTRTSINGSDTWTALSGLSNAPHTYRIERTGTQFRYYVDGTLVATNNGFSSAVKAWVSDYGNGGQKTSADWVRVTPFSTLSGTFESAIVDTGAPGAVTTISYHGATPNGTSLAVRTRTSSNAANWSAWSNPTASGATITSPAARYIQYQLTLTSNSSSVSPEIDDVGFGGGTPPVITGPTVSNITSSSATVSWSTDLSTDGVVSYGLTSSYGSSATDPAGFLTNHSVTLTGLSSGTVYHYQVTSTTNGGASAQSNDATFTTSVSTISTPQTTAADFQSGVLSGTAISEDSGGEVRLAPALNDIFSGGSLNGSLWSVSNWTGGSATVSGGNVTLNGNGIGSQATFSAGAVFEGTATFTGESWQFFGLASDLDGSNGGNRAGFTTGPSGTGMYARTSINNVDTFTAIAGNYLGSSHTYRVEWASSVVRYYIDGTLVVTQNQSVPGPLKAWASDYANSGNVLTAGWLRVTPYAASGTYLSGVFDAGSGSSFATITYGSTTPAGTSVQMRTRASTDGINWSAWSNPVASGGAITSAALRYLQYQITLTTSDTAQTPLVDSVALAH